MSCESCTVWIYLLPLPLISQIKWDCYTNEWQLRVYRAYPIEGGRLLLLKHGLPISIFQESLPHGAEQLLTAEYSAAD
jgi:hypothetical protein